MVAMLSTIGNGGKYIKPHLVKKIISNNQKDENGNKIENVIKPEEKEQVISEKTANEVIDMMQSVVAEGTGKKAQVEGFKVGGKTGTSEDGVNTGKYVTSFIGISKVNEEKIVILVTLYNPTGEGGHSGGSVAAPIAGNILKETLNYLK